MTHYTDLSVQSLKITELDLETSRFSRHAPVPLQFMAIVVHLASEITLAYCGNSSFKSQAALGCSSSVASPTIFVQTTSSCNSFSLLFPCLQPDWTCLEIHSDFWMESIPTPRVCNMQFHKRLNTSSKPRRNGKYMHRDHCCAAGRFCTLSWKLLSRNPSCSTRYLSLPAHYSALLD